jgi:hypothetical protein
MAQPAEVAEVREPLGDSPRVVADCRKGQRIAIAVIVDPNSGPDGLEVRGDSEPVLQLAEERHRHADRASARVDNDRVLPRVAEHESYGTDSYTPSERRTVADISENGDTRVSMPIRVDRNLSAYMRASSGAIHFEVRDPSDPDIASRGLCRARTDVLAIPHPDEPDGPFASFASDVESAMHGPGFWVDMADAEAYTGILEEALERVLIALDASGLQEGCLTWPDSPCERSEVWRPADPSQRLDVSYASDDPPPRTPARPPPPRLEESSNGWSTCSPLRVARARLSLVTGADGRIYAIGGESKHNKTVKTVEMYDTRADSWSRGPSLRIARRGPGVALSLDGRLYAIGGYGSTRGGPRTADTVVTAEAYDPSTQRWEEVAPIKAPAYNEIGAATGSDGRIYALSSGTGGIISDANCFHAYDPSTDAWMALTGPDANYPPWGPTVVAGSDGRIYATGDISGGSLIVHAYDPDADVWQQVSSPDLPRSGFGAALGPDGRIYLAGGAPESRLVAYEPSTDTWQELEPMPADRWMVAAATGIDGRIYVVGGYAANQLMDSVHAYMA